METIGIVTYPADGVKRGSSRDHELIDRVMEVLDEKSLDEIRAYAADSLGELVFRRVKSVYHTSTPTYWYHSPSEGSLEPTVREISKAAAEALPWKEFIARVETRSSKKFHFTTFSSSVFPAEDDLKESVTGRCFNRSELDPVSLRLIKVPFSQTSCPRAIQSGAKRHEGDPASLVAGVVRRNKSGKLEFIKWFIASEQLLKAVLMLTHPTLEIPYETIKGEGQIKAGPAAYAFWMGGNRIVTNTYRKEFLSEMSNGTTLSVEQRQERYSIHVGERLSKNCHTLAFWVQLVKYGRISGNNNIPTTTPQMLPSDPAKREALYIPKPMKFWDLPIIVTNRKPTRLDRAVIQAFGLRHHSEVVTYPVNIRTLRPDADEPELGELLEVAALETLVPQVPKFSETVDRVSSPATEVAGYEGLSQSDSDSEERPLTPEPLVQVYSWADRVDFDSEMDFSTPITWPSSESVLAVVPAPTPTPLGKIASFVGSLIKI